MILISILVVVLIILIYTFYRTMKLVYGLYIPKNYQYTINSNASITYKKFDFKAKDGLVLKGIDYKPKMQARGTILVCHFFGGAKEAILPFVDFLLKVGFRVLSFDFRNHGESGRSDSLKVSLLNDFSAFYETIKAAGIEEPVGIMGFSMGSTPALIALNEYPEIKAAVIDSGPMILVKEYFLYVLNNKNIKNPVYRVLFLLVYLYYVGFLRLSKQTIEILKKNKQKPVMFIHGEKDNIISIKNSEVAVSYLSSSHSSLWRIPNSRHLTNRFVEPILYENKVTQFFLQNLS